MIDLDGYSLAFKAYSDLLFVLREPHASLVLLLPDAGALQSIPEIQSKTPPHLVKIKIKSPSLHFQHQYHNLRGHDHVSAMSELKAYPGSCHCGDVQYQVKLKFPSKQDDQAESVRIYKCNCSTCQKMGYFHLRPINPTEHYILLSPNPKDLGDYRCFEKKHGWYFCKKCGVRVLGLGGSWEQVELDVEKWASTTKETEKETLQTVWKTNGPPGPKRYYLSVNATTLEPSEDTDLRKWHENGWISYCESRREDGTPTRFGRPHEGGMY